MSAEHVIQFLIHLAVKKNVSGGSQAQALNALAFLYKQVLIIALGELDNLVRPKRFEHIPVVLSQAEVKAVLETMKGQPKLAASLLYGTGMRVNECATLRIQDIDLDNRSICIHNTCTTNLKATLRLPTK